MELVQETGLQMIIMKIFDIHRQHNYTTMAAYGLVGRKWQVKQIAISSTTILNLALDPKPY